tara:strand:- start:436 stop:570 length:135 start_codon:yes stop_codon:yes gene_type:complete
MLAGLGKVITFDVKPKLTYKQMKAMNDISNEEVMNIILARDKKM